MRQEAPATVLLCAISPVSFRTGQCVRPARDSICRTALNIMLGCPVNSSTRSLTYRLIYVFGKLSNNRPLGQVAHKPVAGLPTPVVNDKGRYRSHLVSKIIMRDCRIMEMSEQLSETVRTIAPKHSRSHQQRFNFHSGCILHVREYVRVDLERECHRGVSKLFAHDLR